MHVKTVFYKTLTFVLLYFNLLKDKWICQAQRIIFLERSVKLSHDLKEKYCPTVGKIVVNLLTKQWVKTSLSPPGTLF